MHTTPASLLERLRRPGESEAWARFVALYTPLIYYWARRTELQPQDAADLVQDVFATLVEKLPEFAYDSHKSFHGWLRTVTLNKWRDRCKRPALPGEGKASIADLPGPDDMKAFEEAEYHRHLVSRALQVMQADFQPTTWKACWEFVVNGRPAAEVARELGLTVNAVYLAKARVLARLRQELHGLID